MTKANERAEIKARVKAVVLGYEPTCTADECTVQRIAALVGISPARARRIADELVEEKEIRREMVIRRVGVKLQGRAFGGKVSLRRKFFVYTSPEKEAGR